MIRDRPHIGIALMFCFCLIAPAGDAVAKLLGSAVPICQVVLVRFGVQAALLFPIVLMARMRWRMRGTILALTLLRTVLHILGIAAMFAALRYLPLADAVAIAFVMPFFMLLLGRLVLGEVVGLRRLLACAVGFAGTLLVVQPSFADVGWPALLPVFVAANFAVFMLITRIIAKDTDPLGLQAVSGVMAVIIVLPLLGLGLIRPVPPLQMITPSVIEWQFLLAIGLLGTGAHLLMTAALRFAPAATLAPMQYLEIPFATALGLLIFHDLPDPLAMLGIAVIVAAGLYIILRERASAGRPQPEMPPQAPA